MYLRHGVLLALAAVAFAPSGKGNDTVVTLSGGGLVPQKTSKIVMEAEHLEISARRVTVKYIFRNTSDQDIDAVVAFPLPELDGGAVFNAPFHTPTTDPLNFVGFRVLVDGQPVESNVEMRAFKNGREITTRLHADGLPLSVLDKRLDKAARALPLEEQRRLRAEQLLVEEDFAMGPGRKPVRKYWPWWNTRVQYYWSQHFPAKAAVEVEHAYGPVAGGTAVYKSEDLSRSLKAYCGQVTSDTLGRFRNISEKYPSQRGSSVLMERQVHYILTTANNWSGPIRRFRLSVVARPDDIVASCMPGLKEVGAGRYELARTNFHPDQELKVLFLEPANPRRR